MSTRGLLGVRIDGTDKLMYNHSDSYPSGLGWGTILTWHKLVKEKGLDWIRERARALKVVNEDTPPTAEQKELLKDHADLGVSERSLDDWGHGSRSF